MDYTLPTKAAECVDGGDGYDLEYIFTKVFNGTTCTYDDLIFLPGMWCSFVFLFLCHDVIYDRLQRRKPMMSDT